MNIPRLSVRNPVAVNLIMIAIIIGGFYFWFTLVREFFPNVEAERIMITVPYPGATPEEIEESVTRRIERKLDPIEDIEEVSSQVLEGVSISTVKLEDGAGLDRVLNKIRAEMDRVGPDLPQDAEDPEITEIRPKIPVIIVMVHGDVSEERLREEARKVREELLELDAISDTVVSGIRDKEIWVEVRPEQLEEFGLTFMEVGQAVAATNLDLPGGQIKSETGNIRVRTTGEEDRARQLEEIIVRSRPDGTVIRLREVARVRETFEDNVKIGRYEGRPAVSVTVFKQRGKDALKIADAVKKYVAENKERMGGAINIDTTTNLARFIEQRINLMLKNAGYGIMLVLAALLLFLDVRVALWVGVGLAVSFLGTFIVMRLLGETINLISLFGLIIVLGLIVDDAIVVGENVFTRLRNGEPGDKAAEEGATEVAIPVVAAVVTTIVAFLPLAFIEGQIGTFLAVLPKVAIAALAMSLIECFLIMPAHLNHSPHKGEAKGLRGKIKALGDFKSSLIEVHLANLFEWALRHCLYWRYVTLSAAIALSLTVSGLVIGNIVPFVFIQDVDAESFWVNLEMTAGTPAERTTEVIAYLEKQVIKYPEVNTVFSVIGISFTDEGIAVPTDPATVGQLSVELLEADFREAEGMRTSKEVVNLMRKDLMDIPGVKKLAFLLQSGGPTGPDIELRVKGEELETIAKAVAYIRDKIASFEGIVELEDDLQQGKQEVRLELRESARALNMTTRDLALNVRHAFFGMEAQKLQLEDEEVTVRVLLPESARRNLADISNLRIPTPQGHRVPLEEVAVLSMGRGYASLGRVDGDRAVSIGAQVVEDVANIRNISDELAVQLKDIGDRFAGISISFEGQKKETAESMASLKQGFAAAMLMIYIVVAVLFRSYLQPFVVMVAIPFAIVGAIIGHYIMGYPFTVLSMIGGVALAGIVVNDSLILVDFINRKRREGMPLMEAVVSGSRARLRAILLTTITTLFGLAPIMFERSFQAQFLIPMVVSIVFGLACATVLTLVLIPAVYLALEDVISFFRWLAKGRWSNEARAREDGSVE
ncbi:MAG: efflux RND transporter permease subunit [Planctomycetota bacterium]|nr:efflux RND transporter permease subunit [Planctomycetota bacterium]